MHSAPATGAIPGYQAGTWKADPAHSKIAFTNRMLCVSTRGRFTGYDITIVTGEDPQDSTVTATIDLTSIDTAHAKRDHHIASRDYAGAKEHPTAHYRSTAVRRAGDGWAVDGELTLHGVTRPVRLAVEVGGFHHDASAGRQAAFVATGRISRRDFGLAIPGECGGVVIGDKVSLTFEVLAALQS